LDQIVDWGATSGLKIVGAILILIAGRIVAGILRGTVRRILGRRGVDPSLINFTASLVFALIVIFAFLAAAAKFGIETASFVAVLGAVGFAIGFALQGSLSNFASGIMLLLFRPFRVGDLVDVAGATGTVKEIQLFNTILATPDNVQIIVPNSKVYGDTIKNFSAYDIRRVDLLVGIGYGSAIEKAIEVTMGLIKADGRILSDPEPMIAVAELADSSVNLVVRSWVKKEDYWGVKFDLTQSIKEAFDRHGIEIPFPQQVVHMLKPTA
jgi:small conductance mechanosensitive channel